jgi:hypothetical protein
MYLQPVGAMRVLILIHQDEHHVLIGWCILFKDLGGGKSIYSDPLGKVSQNDSELGNLQLSIRTATTSNYPKIQILCKEKGG